MAAKRDFRGRRWLNIGLRSLHLAGVVALGVAVVGEAQPSVAGMILLLSTGLALYGLELWHRPQFWRELAGVFALVKLLGLAATLALPVFATSLFWLLLIVSSVVSHAPYEFRHIRVIS